MAASPFEPEEDDEDQPQPGSAAMLIPPDGGQQPQQSPIPYMISSQGTAQQPQQAAPPQPAQQQAIPAPSTTQPPAILLPSVPQAPGVPDYRPLQDKRAADAATKIAGPKWWERLAGAAVGFGAGYKEGPSAGIRAGSAVTNRSVDAATSNRNATVAADDAAINDAQKGYDTSRKAYEDQLSNFNATMKSADAQQAQANSDRSFNRDTSNDTFNQTRETANDTQTQANADRSSQQEQANHADLLDQQGIQNAFERQRIALERQKADKDDKPAGSKTTVSAGQFQTLLTTRDREYASAQRNMKSEMEEAVTPADKAAVQQKYDGIAADLQDRWNGRLATADPEAKYAPGAQQPATAPATPAVKPAAKPTAPAPNTAPSATAPKAVSLKAAMALPMNKGKTADQVTQDLQARKYRVLP